MSLQRFTVPGGMKSDTTTLVVDESNDRVGIGTATPAVRLDVSGACNISGDLSLGARLYFGVGSNDYIEFGDAFNTFSFIADGASKAIIANTNVIVGTTLTTGIESSSTVTDSTGLLGDGVLAVGRDCGGSNVLLYLNNITATTTSTKIGSVRWKGTEIGRILTTSTATTWSTTSDYRLKTDHGRITDGVERLMRLVPRRFAWTKAPELGVQDGFFAHEVQEVVPEAVDGLKDAMEDGEVYPQVLDKQSLLPLVVAAVQEQQATIGAMAAELAALRALVAA